MRRLMTPLQDAFTWASSQPVWLQVVIGLAIFTSGLWLLACVVSVVFGFVSEALDRVARPGAVRDNWVVLLLGAVALLIAIVAGLA